MKSAIQIILNRIELKKKLTIFWILFSDGQMGESEFDFEISGVASFQLFWGCRDGWQSPDYCNAGGEAFRHCGERGAPHGHLHEKLCALPQTHQRVSLVFLIFPITHMSPQSSTLKLLDACRFGPRGLREWCKSTLEECLIYVDGCWWLHDYIYQSVRYRVTVCLWLEDIKDFYILVINSTLTLTYCSRETWRHCSWTLNVLKERSLISSPRLYMIKNTAKSVILWNVFTIRQCFILIKILLKQ